MAETLLYKSLLRKQSSLYTITQCPRTAGLVAIHAPVGQD